MNENFAPFTLSSETNSFSLNSDQLGRWVNSPTIDELTQGSQDLRPPAAMNSEAVLLESIDQRSGQSETLDLRSNSLDTVLSLRSPEIGEMPRATDSNPEEDALLGQTNNIVGLPNVDTPAPPDSLSSAQPMAIANTSAFIDDIIINPIAFSPDLSGEYFNVVQEPQTAGNNLDVQFRIQNTGLLNAGSFNVKFYLSDNDYISGNPSFDDYLGSYTISNLAAGSTTNLLTKSLTLPNQGDQFWDDLGDGQYYIGMIVDANDTVSETDETNNANTGEFDDYDGLQINNTKLVDLSGEYFNVVQEPRDAGDTIDVQFRIQNTEVSSSGSFDVNFYLSTNDFISPYDHDLGSYTVNNIAGNSDSGLLTATLTLPAQGNSFWNNLGDDVYYVGMYIDEANTVAETNEANNRNTNEFDDHDGVQINNTQLVDLSGEYFNVVQEPRDVGESIDVQFRIQNTEVGSSGSFDVNFYLSTNDFISSFDHDLGSYTVSNIAGNSDSGLLTATFTLPGQGDAFWDSIGDDVYYVGMYIDEANTVAETNEANNRNTNEFDDHDGVQINSTNTFTTFSLEDASGDSTTDTVFANGVLRLDYDWGSPSSLSSMRLQALQGGSVVSTLRTWTSASRSDELINLADFSSLAVGNYDLRLVARNSSGEFFTSASQSISILPWFRTNGSFTADTLNYAGGFGSGSVFLGRGGTDTLNLAGISTWDVAHINGVSLGTFSGSTANQAIFGGTAFDYLTLNDGREIYFQGIETLGFSNGSVDLLVEPNDTHFGSQWNLHISDVDSAWRFTQGSSGVLLASLDSGILTPIGGSGGIYDIPLSQLIIDASDDDNGSGSGYGHGHKAISVMSSTANNFAGVAGINWNSDVYVNDVYNGVNLQQAISDTIAYARANNLQVVFQGGIQGDYWLTSGGSQAQLEQLIQDNSDIAMFAIAAGNGGPGGNLYDPNYLNSVSGVAALETTHDNVMSVGALARTGTSVVNGLTNASSVNLASYSNRGSNLTMVAATNSPAMDKFNNMSFFGGTSAANPNMAGIASLVWSVNSNLDGGEVRQVLIDTAMDLGASGRDNTFGHGLVNADAAVRRAWALDEDEDLANLYSGGSVFA